MAQVWIREFDAKKMYFDFIGQKYNGYKISQLSDIEQIDEDRKYVAKPDMLFGKRGKYGLVWVALGKQETWYWIHERFQKQMEISDVEWTLDVFIVEDFVPHNDEYYISFFTKFF